jgi:TolA-binding protein
MIMSKKMLIAGACVMALLLLVGCQADKESAEKVTESTTSSFSASIEDTATETEEAKDEVATEDTEEVINEVNSKDTEIVEKVAEAEEKCGNVSDNVKKGQTKKSTGNAESKQSDSKAESESTKQTATSKSTERETPQPTTESPKDTEAPKPTEQPKPSIDIDGQISFAKEYASSIGLTLDSTATDCWDNPITVNAGKADVKGDIKSRLNRYKNTEGFTSIWVWAVKISDTEYELYIGYA